MALLPIIVAPDPRLKVVCEPVDDINDDIRKLVTDMLETMYDAPGLGLAAPQVGVKKRLLVVDVAKDDDAPDPHPMINPELTWASKELFEYEEGCLSLPKYYANVSRPDKVHVSYLDENGDSRELKAEGLLAVVVQHEMDHLEGILFVDHLSMLKRNVILRKLKKMKKQRQLETVGA